MENPLSVEERLIKLVTEHLAARDGEVTLESSFEHLGADALYMLELIMKIEDEFGIGKIPCGKMTNNMTVAQAAKYVRDALAEANPQALSGSPA